ncbi:MAG: hypothetical protein FD167_5194 [bacterium]|nr:MAG: hypothetical protein FD167_5194 [bacterium]
MSSRLSRSGGRFIGTMLRRKNKSSRNVPFSTILLKSRLVAVITLTLTLRKEFSPKRINSPSCRILNNLTCKLKGNSPISSKKTVPLWASSNKPFLS